MRSVNVQYEFLIPIDKRKITGIEKHTSRFFMGLPKIKWDWKARNDR